MIRKNKVSLDLARLILYIIISIIILSLLILTFFPGTIRAWLDAGKSTEEKCISPPGYIESQWREHMSHHPEIYKECLT